MKRKIFLYVIIVCNALTLFSCSSYVYQSIDVRRHLSQQEYDAALDKVEKVNSGSSKLVYLYEKGLILHYANEFERSNEAFDQAEILLDDLYTRSLSREIGALLTTDNIVEYRGERHEAAFVHYYRILNYLYLNQIDAAVIECRKLNYKLQLFSDHGDSYYRNDPFLQYLTAMVYKTGGDNVDADVSLRVALESYQELGERLRVQPPNYFYCDLIDNAEYFGDFEVADLYRNEGKCLQSAAGYRDVGILNLFVECGYVPLKKEEVISLPILKEDIDDDLDEDAFAETLLARHRARRGSDVKVEYWLKVAVPALQVQPSGIHSVEIASDRNKKASIKTALVVDLESLTLEAFEQRKNTILLRTVTRSLAKYLAKKKAEEKKGEIAGFLVNIFNVATESADTRIWSTLPGKIFMGRLICPEGSHNLEIRLLDEAGHRLDTVKIQDVEVTAGRQTFLNYRIY